MTHRTCIPYPTIRFPPYRLDFQETKSHRKPLDALFIPTHRSGVDLKATISKLANAVSSIFVMPSKAALRTANFNGQAIVLREFAEPSWRAHFLDLRSSRNPTRLVSTRYDLPLKRNYALSFARNRGYRRIGILDDDIQISEEHVVTATQALHCGFDIAGFYVLNYPDVSTIDHIIRETSGHPSETILGGNCLFFDTERIDGFFPYVYNEDWFFLMNNLSNAKVAACGELSQYPHTPWKNLSRVRFEQFGDAIIDGMLTTLEEDGILYPQSPRSWSQLLTKRRGLLTKLIGACSAISHRRAVSVALDALKGISGDACHSFVRALHFDFNNPPSWPIPIHESK